MPKRAAIKKFGISSYFAYPKCVRFGGPYAYTDRDMMEGKNIFMNKVEVRRIKG